MASFRVETPPNLDEIFKLECFKFLDLKDLLKHIYGHLDKLGDGFDAMNTRFGELENNVNQ